MENNNEQLKELQEQLVEEIMKAFNTCNQLRAAGSTVALAVQQVFITGVDMLPGGNTASAMMRKALIESGIVTHSQLPVNSGAVIRKRLGPVPYGAAMPVLELEADGSAANVSKRFNAPEYNKAADDGKTGPRVVVDTDEGETKAEETKAETGSTPAESLAFEFGEFNLPDLASAAFQELAESHNLKELTTLLEALGGTPGKSRSKPAMAKRIISAATEKLENAAD